MSATHSCGCEPAPCSCCEGTQALTPTTICNRPGLAALEYRAGTHARFLETMKARIGTMSVEGVAADGQTIEVTQPLEGLTTRDSNDPSIALLDGWASVADVLTFYQERNANEGYLRTATERRSVLELARLVGYVPRPGVAASAYLAYTVDAKQVEPTMIPAGAAAQSIPGPGETAQTFETSEDLEARREWNDLAVRRTRPQDIRLSNVLSLANLLIAGPTTTLKVGDPILFVFDPSGEPAVLRRVGDVGPSAEDGTIRVGLAPVSLGIATTVPLLAALVLELRKHATPASLPTGRGIAAAESILRENYLENYSNPFGWAESIKTQADGQMVAAAAAALDAFGDVMFEVLTQIQDGSGTTTTDPALFAAELLRPTRPQVANRLQLRRDLKASFGQGADTSPQVLLRLAPRLRDTYYAAWSTADVNPAQPELLGVYALRATVALFGSGASRQPTYYGPDVDGHTAGELKPQSEWEEWPIADDEQVNVMFLEQAVDGVLPMSFALVHRVESGEPRRRAFVVARVDPVQRTAYGISGKSTRLTFDEVWWDKPDMATLRSTLVQALSEPLTLVEAPIEADVSGATIELGGLYRELESGRWVIVSGERADIPGVAGVRSAELLMISGLQHGFDPNLPGDRTHTTLRLATETAYAYKRKTLTIYGNVVPATHGETRKELLGSGDGAQALQGFELKQPPVTYTSVPTASGAESSLRVYVNDVEWHESGSLAFLGPKDRGFVTFTDDDAKTTVIFGDGDHGARLPTGVLNVASVYRGGIGAPGNVRAEQITLLQTRPLGVNTVVNPLRASGGADRESRDLARENAPLSVMPLDRLVSIRDYADLARGFAGVAKAMATRTSDGRRTLLYLTIAGVDDAPIDVTSDLYRNLGAALRRYGDPDLPLRIDVRELQMLVLSARIRVIADHRWEPVATAVRARLLETFGFGTRSLGQPALLSEAFAAIQGVRGVDYVDVDAFGAIPEKTTDAEAGTRRLLTQEEIADQVRLIVEGPAPSIEGQGVGSAGTLPHNVIAWGGGSFQGNLRPAGLAILVPDVRDTIVLNQITG